MTIDIGLTKVGCEVDSISADTKRVVQIRSKSREEELIVVSHDQRTISHQEGQQKGEYVKTEQQQKAVEASLNPPELAEPEP